MHDSASLEFVIRYILILSSKSEDRTFFWTSKVKIGDLVFYVDIGIKSTDQITS